MAEKLNETDDYVDDAGDGLSGGGGYTGVGPGGAPYTGYAPPPPPQGPINEPGVESDPFLNAVLGGVVDGAVGIALEIGMAAGEKLGKSNGGGGKGK